MEDRINPYNNKNIEITEADINNLLESHQVYYKIIAQFKSKHNSFNC